MRAGVAALGLVVGASAPAASQELLDVNLSLGRTVSLRPGTGPHGMAVDEASGDLYLVTDAGRDLSVLTPGGMLTRVADNVGDFNGAAVDLRFGPDGNLYAMGGANIVQRFMRDGTPLAPLAMVPNGPLNAWGLDFDRAGNLYASDRSANLYRVTPAGVVSVFSSGWQDIDEVVAGPDDSLFVHDGSSRVADRDKVFVVDHTGASRVYASGLGEVYTGAYDWATGDYYAANTAGELYRLRDMDSSGDITPPEITLVGRGFTYINAITIGRSSQDPAVGSIYIGNYLDRVLYEVTGLQQVERDFGPRIDDDRDGFCERGRDMNADGDCLDMGEQDGSVDCADDNAAANPGAMEVCDDGVDNDCDLLVDGLDVADCVALVDGDGDGYCVGGQDMNADGDCADLGEPGLEVDCNDGDPAIFPGAMEVCTDGIDNNCDLIIDEADLACVAFVDGDSDGYCVGGRDFNDDGDCADMGEQVLTVDCDDANAAINPGAAETCNDGVDNDCDLLVDALDPACNAFTDADGDGFCPQGQDMNADGDCSDLGEQNGESDCDEGDMAVNSAAEELCLDGADNNCDGVADELDGACGAFVDNDGDGYCELGQDMNDDGDCTDLGEQNGAVDCADNDLSISPGAVELCDNAFDNDCDGDPGLADSDCQPVVDGDQDGYCPVGQDLNGDGDCVDGIDEVLGASDCNDNDAAINPGAMEACTDGIDNNCDLDTDEADVACVAFVDGDGDGFCPMGQDANLDGDCADLGEQNGAVDCADNTAQESPGNVEICDDEFDNDCDGDINFDDADCNGVIHDDGDDDGFCVMGQDMNADGDCDDDGEQNGAADCDDDNAAINPDATEVCDDGADNNCDGDADEADAACGDFVDNDGDGYCELGQDMNDDGDCSDMGEQNGAVDCADNSAQESPGNVEICDDEFDNDCDGDINLDDSDCTVGVDGDGDGYCPVGQDLNDDGDCLDGLDEVGGARDCDDANGDINPNAAEVCTDGADNNCDGDADEADAACGDFVDNDGDGYCELGQDMNDDGDCADDGEQNGAVDCADNTAQESPGNVEICDDEFDNDCDGDINRADRDCAEVVNVDADGDGLCEQGQDLTGDGDCDDDGEQDMGADCDDANPAIYAGAAEICGDGIDSDCGGQDDRQDPACLALVDLDGDGACAMGYDYNLDGDCFGDNEAAMAQVDCLPMDAAASPFAAEVCGDGIDNDCDGAADAADGDCAEVADADGDGFCPVGVDANGDGDCLDEDEDTEDADCDDEDDAVNPDAAEVCGDEIDNNCDGDTDGQDVSTCGPLRRDRDGDGFCREGIDRNGDGFCDRANEMTQDSDCNDGDAAINPGAAEVCDDNRDNNCDGVIDYADADACPVPANRADRDGDGYCSSGRDINGDGDCLDRFEDSGATDCDDSEATINPAAAEICDDRIDNNCDSRTDAQDTINCGEGDPNNGANNGDNNGEVPGDADGDGIIAARDNCPWQVNPEQTDSDQDGVGDACDPTFNSDVEGSSLFRCSAAQGHTRAPGLGALLLIALGLLALRRR